jgi:hypothetical protein
MFPFIFRRYWFVTTYIILYFLAPYINKLLDNLSKEDNVKLICFFVFFVSFLPTFTKLDFYGNELIQFIMFYIIGAYFKKYQDNVFSRSKKNNYIFFVICALMLISSVIVLDILQVKYNISFVESTYFFSRYSFIALMFSISLFNIFVNKKEFYSKTINVISSCVFGIYLLSDHNIVRRFLWVDILKNNEFVNSNYFVLHFIISIFLVFIVCGIVEYVRKHTLEKFILRYIKDIDDKFRSSFKRFIKIKSK